MYHYFDAGETEMIGRSINQDLYFARRIVLKNVKKCVFSRMDYLTLEYNLNITSQMANRHHFSLTFTNCLVVLDFKYQCLCVT